ncbi:MAG: hypothetical protein U9Q97_00215 [Acidobacteriota bacterium]|nr:hypothetical protein [Acidobacteriota bacterium]
MILTKTFEAECIKTSRIPTFFTSQGFRMVKNLRTSYTFKRGSILSVFYTFDVRKCPTTVDVNLIECDDDKYQVMISYDVSGKGLQIFTSGDRQKIMSEMDSLEIYTKAK